MSSEAVGHGLVYHLADPDEWAAARREGAYRRSTRGMSLDEVDFVHTSDADQWPATRARFYGDVTSDLVLLEIDVTKLGSPLVREVGNPQTGEVFPHVYGPIEVEAVVSTRILPPPHR